MESNSTFLAPDNKPHVFTMYEAACVIVEDLPSKLVDYFNSKFLKNPSLISELQKYLLDWKISNANTTLMDSYPALKSITEPELINLIFCELSTIFSQWSEVEALNRYREIWRQRKKYLYTQLREEMGEVPIKARNSLFLKQEWDAVNNPFIRNSMEAALAELDLEKTDFATFKKKRFQDVTSWYKTKDNLLTDFPYFEALSPSRRFKLFLIDLSHSCLLIICRNYYRNKTGFVTRTLDTHLGLNEISLFSWQSNVLELDYEVINDTFQIFESFQLSPTNSVKIIIYEEPFSNDKAVDPEAMFDKIKQEIEDGQQYRTMDTFDVTILNAILSNFSVTSPDKSVRINFIDLAYDVYRENTSLNVKHCERLIRHIIKLGRTRISNVSTSDNGLLIGGGSITFFEYNFQVIRDESIEDENILTTINMATGNTSIDYGKLSMKDYGAMELTFYLSNYMYNLWTTSRHTYISSTLYKQIESSKGRALIHVLQEERLRIHPELDAFIPMTTLRSYFKVTASLTRFRKELDKELRELENSGVAVESYEVVQNGLKITFKPLSTAEKTIYKV